MCAGQDYLSVDLASFNHDETCKKMYTKINETFKLIKMDLVHGLYIHSLVSMEYDKRSILHSFVMLSKVPH